MSDSKQVIEGLATIAAGVTGVSVDDIFRRGRGLRNNQVIEARRWVMTQAYELAIPQSVIRVVLHCSASTVNDVLKPLRIAAREHEAQTRMPENPVADRPDYDSLMSAIRRAGDSAVRQSQVAARYRLPYAIVRGLSMRGTE